jgi:hypothetical protein
LPDLVKTVINDLMNPTIPGGYGLVNNGYFSLEEEMVNKEANSFTNRNQAYLEDPTGLDLR